MSAKSFSEQFSNLQYIVKFVPKSALSFTLISLLFIYNSLLRCFLLFRTFLIPSLSWFFILALVPPENPWAPGLWECWGSGRADGEQSERGSSALVPMPFPALQFCPSPLVLLELWIWEHTKPTSVQLWKKKGASLMTSAIHPPGTTFLISGVAFTVLQLLQLQNLAVNWKVLPGLHKEIPASTRFVLTWRWSLVLPACVWLLSGFHRVTWSNKWDGIA